MPSETHVTGTQMRVTVDCAGRVYTLRPITFGEAADIAQAEAGETNVNETALNEVIRQALKKAGHTAAAEAIDAHEDAQIAMYAMTAAEPHAQEPPEAFREWREERQRLHQTLLRALVAKDRAARLVADDPEVRATRSALERGAWQRRIALLTLSLDWTAEQVAALPAGDAETLLAKAEAMRRPGSAEGKA